MVASIPSTSNVALRILAKTSNPWHLVLAWGARSQSTTESSTYRRPQPLVSWNPATSSGRAAAFFFDLRAKLIFPYMPHKTKLAFL